MSLGTSPNNLTARDTLAQGASLGYVPHKAPAP
jgi:hypothetical protein